MDERIFEKAQYQALIQMYSENLFTPNVKYSFLFLNLLEVYYLNTRTEGNFAYSRERRFPYDHRNITPRNPPED